VEPLAIAESILNEIGKACLMSNLNAKRFHLIEEVVERVAVCEAALCRELPRLFANGAIGLLEEWSHLGQGAFLTSECNRHRAHDLLVLLFELRELGLAGDVGLSEQCAAVRERAVEHRIAGLGQLGTCRRIEIAATDVVLDRLEFRLDVANKR